MTRDVIVLSGIPGSGKTTFGRGLVACGGVILSADDYFTGPDGVYRFIPTEVLRAHNHCKRRFVAAMRAGTTPIVIDNTNTTAKEIEYYVDEALAHGYQPRVVRIHADPADAFARQRHGVPPEHFAKVVKRFGQRHVRPHWQIVEIGV